MDMSEKCEAEGTKDDNETLMCTMSEWEWRLQCKEKFGIYLSTFSYERDDSDLDSHMELDLNVMAHPFLQ